MNQIIYVGLGLVAGIFGGIFGVGGGVIMIPALVMLFGLTQQQAQGTSLAVMLPPVGILAVMKYYSGGNVKLDIALYMCLGFLIGGFIGATFAEAVPNIMLKRIFGVFLLVLSINCIFAK